MKNVKILSLLTSLLLEYTTGYKLLDYRNISSTTINFYSCTSISPILQTTTTDVMQELNDYDLFDFKLNKQQYKHEKNGKNTICNKNLDTNEYSEFGICTHYAPYFNETDISISNMLIGTETNLYNVVLHELLHSVGLDHTNSKGMMNYTLQSRGRGYIKDKEKLYLSLDDYNGMKKVYDEINKCKC